jgi:GNAT superfamily N-acetyltransferase
LLTFTARCFGHPVGYANVYVTNDMHNGDRIAQEDALFVTKGHRKGVGRKLTLYGLNQLRQMGVSRLNVSAVTDTRAVSLWSRLGFLAVATEMVYQF